MTQDTSPVGGSDEPIIAAEPTLEERLAAVSDQPEEETPAEEEQPEGEQPEGEAPEEAEAPTEEEAELPPISPPVSWDDEAKAVFASLPREAQEIVSKREADRERFVQSKAQEAKSARVEAEKQALSAIQNASAIHAQQLSALQVQLPERPSPRLQADDPWAYAEKLEAYENAAAHNQWIEQQLSQVQQMAQHAEQEQLQLSHKETEALLQEKFPEYLDPVKGKELRQELGSTALELGYSEDQLANVDGNDILAMKLATEWRSKAAKYDKLMAQKMETVRSAKTLKPVSKPGAASAPGTIENSRYAADRNAMKGGDRDAAIRVMSRFL